MSTACVREASSLAKMKSADRLPINFARCQRLDPKGCSDPRTRPVRHLLSAPACFGNRLFHGIKMPDVFGYADTEETVQEVFVNVFSSLDGFRGEGAPVPDQAPQSQLRRPPEMPRHTI